MSGRSYPADGGSREVRFTTKNIAYPLQFGPGQARPPGRIKFYPSGIYSVPKSSLQKHYVKWHRLAHIASCGSMGTQGSRAHFA